MQGTFKRDNTFEKRLELCNKIKERHRDRIPIVTELLPGVNINLAHTKFLVPLDISMGGFLTEIRRQTKLQPEEAIYIYCGNKGSVLVPTNQRIHEVYEKYGDRDGFLYITIATENTFGMLSTLQQLSENLLDNTLRTSGKVVSLLHLDF